MPASDIADRWAKLPLCEFVGGSRDGVVFDLDQYDRMPLIRTPREVYERHGWMLDRERGLCLAYTVKQTL